MGKFLDAKEAKQQRNLLAKDIRLGLAPKTSLFRADLNHTNLRGANLRDADLRCANLVGANLKRADFWAASLRGANLKGADLRKCRIWAAPLSSACMSGANLSGCLIDRYYDSSDIYLDCSDADFTKATLKKTGFCKITLRGANFSGANLQNASFLSVKLQDVNFTNANLKGAYLGAVWTFAGANFTNANLKGTYFGCVDLSGAKGLTLKQIQQAITNENTILPSYLTGYHSEKPKHAEPVSAEKITKAEVSHANYSGQLTDEQILQRAERFFRQRQNQR